MLNKLSKKDVINYSILFALVLVILSSFDHSFNMKVVISFFLMSIIIYWLTNNVCKSLTISFMISFVYYITNNQMYENFESEVKVDEIVKELSNISDTMKKDDKDSLSEESEIKNLDNKEQLKVNEITEEDVNLLDDDDKTPTEDNKYIESAKAQRETFRLINTIKQLDDTVKTLAPTLKQGANIIDKFRKLNLIVE